MVHSILQQTAMSSQLGASTILGSKTAKWKRSLAAELLLTALIDAFSILTIFLLMSFSSTGEIIFINKGMELPKAAAAEVLERNPVVKIEDNQIFLDSEKISSGDSLFRALLALKKSYAGESRQADFLPTVTVQADRRIKYEFLNQVVVACAQAGFSDIRFAVLMK